MRSAVIINNKFLFSSTDNTVVSPEDSIGSNFIDTSNTALAKIKAIVPEMITAQTDWLQSTPTVLINTALLGISNSYVKYCIITSTNPIYVWVQDPQLPDAQEHATHIIVNRLFVLDGGITSIYAVNPAVFSNGGNDAEVKLVFGYII